MNEKYKKGLKNIGIAGFLFFLVKGILWLILGTAFLKWLKEIFLVSFTSLLPILVEAQTTPLSINQIKPSYSTEFQIYKPKLQMNEYKKKPFFCKLEDQLNENKKTYFKFRLGSIDYSNQLEYFKDLQNKEQGNLYLR